jgi:SAM-dependent methyltransferase
MTVETIDGYVNDTPYMDSVWTDHAPSHLRFRALAHGAAAPDLSSFTYLDLGCGTGVGTTLYAGLYPGSRFIGIDANPAHIAQARAFARETNVTNVVFIEATFEDILTRPPADLPPCDFVIVHGVYSWVDENNRQTVRRLLSRVCASGAIVFLSYNALPGNGAMLPFQRLLHHAASLVGGSSEERLSRAQEVVGCWIARGDAYFASHGIVRAQRDRMMERSLSYQAHELLNGTWTPFLVTEVAQDMAREGFQFVGHGSEIMPPLTDTTLEGLPESVARLWNELARDYTRNTMFRGDLYRAPSRDGCDAPGTGGIADEWLCSLTGLTDLTASLPDSLRKPDVTALIERWWTMLRQGPRKVGELLMAGMDVGEETRFLLWYLVDTRGFIPGRAAPDGVEAARRINLALLREPPFGRRVSAMAVPLTGASFNIVQSVALSWLVEQAYPDLDVTNHARELRALLDLREEGLVRTGNDDPTSDDELGQEIALLGHAVTHVRRGRDRMRMAGLI